MAGSYSKLGDPMMASSSYYSGSLEQPDRTTVSPFGISQYPDFRSPSALNFEFTGGSSATSGSSGDLMSSGSSAYDFTRQPFYQTPVMVDEKGGKESVIASDTSGLYTNFYNSQGMSSPEYLPSGGDSSASMASYYFAPTSPSQPSDQIPADSFTSPIYVKQPYYSGKPYYFQTYSPKPATPSASSSSSNSKRSGAVALKLNDAVLAKYSNMYRKAPSGNYPAPSPSFYDIYPISASSQASDERSRKQPTAQTQTAFVPMTSTAADQETDDQQVRPASYASSSAAPKLIKLTDEFRQASAGSKKGSPQQGQQQPALVYMKPKSVKSSAAATAAKQRAESAELIDGFKSLESTTDSENPRKSQSNGWLSMEENKAPLVSGNDADEQQVPSQPAKELPQRVSRTATSKKQQPEIAKQTNSIAAMPPTTMTTTTRTGAELRLRQSAGEQQQQPPQVTFEHWQQVAQLTAQANNDQNNVIRSGEDAADKLYSARLKAQQQLQSKPDEEPEPASFTLSLPGKSNGDAASEAAPEDAGLAASLATQQQDDEDNSNNRPKQQQAPFNLQPESARAK